MSFNTSPLILSLSNSLRDLIESNLEINQNDIHFESPGELNPLPDQGLSLFLYKISENPFLKNSDDIQEKYSNPEVLKKPPLPLDLYYLVTPFGSGTTKLITIEKILQLFHERSILREDVLSRDLVEHGNKEIRIVLNDLTIEQVNNLLGMFPNLPYSLSISYIVTPLLLETLSSKEISRVISKDTFYYKVKNNLRDKE